jgi:cell wall-associated NlpC family hydrolase
MNGNRDCSGLMMDIFRSMGIKLKRNTSQQEFMSPLRKDIKSMNKLEKETLLLLNMQDH